MHTIQVMEAKDIRVSDKPVQRKLYLNGRKAIAGQKYAILSVSVPNPLDTRKEPCIDVCFKVGKYATHLFLNSITEYEQFTESLAESCDYLLDRDNSLQGAFRQAVDIYQKYQNRQYQ